ncbi:MAG: hypothetical protein FJ388_18380 [Verrucomicrobia bacterium]|nr:hypothetical protein [Verrucomicrobiota bacterium]
MPALATHRLAAPGRMLLLSAGGLLAAGWLCLLAQPAVTPLPPPSGPVATPSPVVLPPAAPGQTNAIPQTATGTTNSLAEIIANDPAFQRFTNLVANSLFTPTSAATETSGTDVPAFAANLRLTGIVKFGDDVQVSIEDRNEPDKKFFVRIGETIADTEVKVVSVDFPGRAVVLAKGEEQGRLEYESEAAPAPAIPGMPGMPPGGPQRPGMPPTAMPGGPQGPRGAMSQPPPPQAGAGPGGADTRMSRAQNRQQTIDRLRQMLQTTTDPAAQQRLRSYIQLLERAAAQEP